MSRTTDWTSRVAVAFASTKFGRRVDRVEQGAVTDDDARGRRVAGTGVVDDDAGDGRGGPCRSRLCSPRYGAAHTCVALRLNASRVVRQVEVDGREAVALALDREGDGIDATERMPGCLRRGAAAAEGDGRGRVAAAGNVDGDAGDGAGGLDVRARGRQGAGAGDRDGRGRVVVTGVRDGQAGDGAVGADGGLSSRARACARSARRRDGRAERIGATRSAEQPG